MPQSALQQYLVKGPTGFITVDYDKIFKASNYYAFDNAAIASVSGCSNANCTVTSPAFATASNTGGTSGAFDEKNYGAYLMSDGVLHLGDRDLKWDVGVRWFETHQTIISPVQHTDPRNAGLVNGGLYPNYFTFVAAKNDYNAFLPNLNVVYNVADDFLVRGSISRTMTRPDPSQMISVVNFSDPTAAQASVGNPALKPYYSNNIDLGAEYYTGGEGYVSVAVFRKSISNFTNQVNITQPFSYLAQFGINYASLTDSQQRALCGRTSGCADYTKATDATVANTTLTVTEQVNSPGLKIINGIELGYVQPLDFLLERYGFKGFGFSGNLTIIDQKATGSVPSIAVGVAPFTYNVTGYYDDGSISARLSYGFADTSYASLSNQQSVCLPAGSGPNCPQGAYLYAKAYGQADFSSSVHLNRFFGDLPSDPELTFDVQNIFSAKQVSYFQLPDAIHSYYIKGQTYLFGIRGTF
ncbi:MAG: TonB-dependent receptor [Rhizomicrobium sp.]